MLNGENAVKAYRVDRGMTQKQLAGEIGINAVYLSQIEAGKGTGSTRTRTKLADTLNVSLEDLL